MSKNSTGQVKQLFTLWLILYILYSVAGSIYCMYEQNINHYNPITMLSGFQIVSLAVVALFFIPFLFVVHRRAVAAQLKKIYKLTGFFLLALCVWSVILFLLMIIEVALPGVLT